MSKVTNHIDALDGLRTLAVGVVMAFHFGLPIYGGTIGVDAFFVLSGYLITTVMLRDFEKHGEVRFLWFWSRRLRRLAPAMILVVLFVACVSLFLAPAYQRPLISGDIVSTLTYSANWHFIQTTSYFFGDGQSSPLLHMWTLAVEEQFYIIWPIIFYIVGRFSPPQNFLVRIKILSLAIVVGSSVELFILWHRVSVDRGYMGTDSRAFQIAIGAFLASLATNPEFLNKARSIRGVILSGSLLILLFACFKLGNSVGLRDIYPNGGAFLVALFSATAILGVISGASLPSKILAMKPLPYLGKLSYGMYLWHWPLYIFTVAWFDEKFPNSRIFVTTLFLFPLTIAFASLSYHLLETPIRYGNLSRWLTPKRTVATFLSVMLGLGLVSTTALAKPPAENVLLLVGDSVPDRMTPYVNDALVSKGWTAVSAAYGNCPALAFGIVDPDGEYWGPGEDCDKGVKKLQNGALDTYNPSAILFWSRYEISDRYDSNGNHLIAGTDEFWAMQQKELTSRLDVLQRNGAAVYLMKIEPVGIGISSNPQCTPLDCHWFLERLRSKNGQDLILRWNQILEEVASTRRNVYVLDISGEICTNEEIPCLDTKLTAQISRPDGSHFDEYSAVPLAQIISKLIVK